jgi:hypothetical protein
MAGLVYKASVFLPLIGLLTVFPSFFRACS